MKRRKLPLGVQTFATVREEDYYYVDKTAFALKLVDEGKHYFLSRPRRFGKSLFLDTLKELFEGNKSLFHGLAAHDQWDWSVKYPVMRFSFGSGNFSDPSGLLDALNVQLTFLETDFQILRQLDTAGGRFAYLVTQVHKKTGLPVVILVDEYDKPILDALQNPALARKNRDLLIGFYKMIKYHDPHIRFSFFTGVSNFSQGGMFSVLNNLSDITLDPDYSSLCGYTDDDIDTVFAAELEGLDREKIRTWYHGYNWLGERVYNPYDVLNLFSRRSFQNYWFETGTPAFLVDLLFKRQISSLSLDHMHSSHNMLSSFDVDDMTTEALLFQTGYLTIRSTEVLDGNIFYTLGFPNYEVYKSLNESLLYVMVKNPSEQINQSLRLYKALQINDFEALKTIIHAFFAGIPHHWYTNNDIQSFEGFYASVFYSYFAALGLDVIVEDCTNHGRLDMTLKFNDQVYLFEFKVVELVPEGRALQQIKDKRYADKYRGLDQPIHLIGVEFSKEDRNLVGFEVEQTL